MRLFPVTVSSKSGELSQCHFMALAVHPMFEKVLHETVPRNTVGLRGQWGDNPVKKK
jgi:hypothetical protein